MISNHTKFASCWGGHYIEMMKKLEQGIKCNPWHVEATPMKHFGECFDIRFEYLPNFNISIYRVKSISRMPSLWKAGNGVGWVTQFIIYANGRELCRLNGCAHLEPDTEKVTILSIALAIIDRVARLKYTPNRRFQVDPIMMLKPSDVFITLQGVASREIVECPLLVPTLGFEYMLAMLYQLYLYENGGVAKMFVGPSYSFADMMISIITSIQSDLFPPNKPSSITKMLRKMDIIPGTTGIENDGYRQKSAVRQDGKKFLMQFRTHSDVEYFGKKILAAAGFIVKGIDLSLYSGVHNLRSMRYRMKENDIVDTTEQFEAPYIIDPADDWTVIENENLPEYDY